MYFSLGTYKTSSPPDRPHNSHRYSQHHYNNFHNSIGSWTLSIHQCRRQPLSSCWHYSNPTRLYLMRLINKTNISFSTFLCFDRVEKKCRSQCLKNLLKSLIVEKNTRAKRAKRANFAYFSIQSGTEILSRNKTWQITFVPPVND